MSRKVTVNLFDVSRTDNTPPLSAILDEYAALPLHQRLRTDVRLEMITPCPADNVVTEDVYHLDFAKIREIGPGKMDANNPISDVGLDANELFGEETAAIYVPSKKWLLVLNNHYGIGPTKMASYFNTIDPGSNREIFYTISPKIDQAALEKMQAMQNFAEIEISANVGAFETGEVFGESVFEATNEINAHRLTLKLCANEAHKKGNFLNGLKIRSLLDRLLTNENEISKLKVKSADETANDSDRFIDLIEQKIKQQFDDSSLHIFNHRYTLESKIRLLRRACRHWISALS